MELRARVQLLDLQKFSVVVVELDAEAALGFWVPVPAVQPA